MIVTLDDVTVPGSVAWRATPAALAFWTSVCDWAGRGPEIGEPVRWRRVCRRWEAKHRGSGAD